MLLDLQHIDKAYVMEETSVPVLFDVSLQVEEGEYLAIMGPSGSGKSTLMNIIGCLDLPTAGTFYLNGENVLAKDDNELSELRNKTIGFVFQNFNLLPRSSALENVALPLLYAGVGRKERNERAMKALEAVGLGDRAYFKPTQLSGGQKQRVAIARAMANHPKVLLADEPTGALDSASGEQVMDLFDELHAQGVTIIMITHAREIAARAERMVEILDGRIYDPGKEAAEKEAAEKEAAEKEAAEKEAVEKEAAEKEAVAEGASDSEKESQEVRDASAEEIEIISYDLKESEVSQNEK